MLIPFVKMNAQGNDFVILDMFSREALDLDFPALARTICQRNFGVGADGLVLILPHPESDAQMIIYNNDGSRAEMCGSALRCVASLLMQKTGKDRLRIQTDSQEKLANRQGELITVNLGKPLVLNSAITVEGFSGDLVDIGNPHFIVFKDDLANDPHLSYGAMLEHHPVFDKPVNVHFVQIIHRGKMLMKIWEHACGATLACGTGAASAVFAGIKKGLLDPQVEVQVPGGTIFINATETGDMLLTGKVSESFRGTYLWKT